MLTFFFILSYYQEKIDIKADSYFTNFPLLNFGFNKNAHYSINISNLDSQMVFGLATKNEIKKIKSLQNDQQNCQGSTTLSKIQYLISKDTEINGKISSKSVLTPYSFSCNKSYTFTLNIDYINSKNHLDFRCQNMMTCMLVFSILFFVVEVFFIIYCIFYEKSKNLFHIYIDLFIIIVGSINVISYLLFNFSKNYEYFIVLFSGNYYGQIVTYAQKLLKVITSVLFLVSLLIVSMINFHFYRLHSFKKFNLFDILNMLLFLLVSLVCLTFIVVIHVMDTGFVLFIFPASFYVLYVSFQFNISSPISMTKIASFFYIFGNFFTFALRSTFINQTSDLINTNTALIIMNVVSFVVQLFAVALFLIGYVYYHDHAIAEVDNRFVLQSYKAYTNID